MGNMSNGDMSNGDMDTCMGEHWAGILHCIYHKARHFERRHGNDRR